MTVPYYPVFLALRDAPCLVVGGGAVGERKARSLLDHGARVFIISRELTPWLEKTCRTGRVTLLSDHYQRNFLQAMALVFAATSDPELNGRIAADAREMNVWCNLASDPQEGSFIVPSLVHRGSLSIAISTGGTSPALAKQIREQLEAQFGPEWEQLLRFMELFRRKVQSKGLGTAVNQDLFRKVSRLPLIRWMQERLDHEATGSILEICDPWLTRAEIESIWKETWNPSSS